MADKRVNVRNFGICKVEWKIKNMFATTCDKNWTIGSPVFTINAKKCTKWRLFLKVNHVDRRHPVVAYLVNINSDAEKEPLWVSWMIIHPLFKTPVQIEADLSKKTRVSVKICDAPDLVKIIRFGEEDTLIIRSIIFVSNKDSQIYERPKHQGLKSLSDDFRLLYAVRKNYDVKLRSGDFKMVGHKGILSFRSRVLKTAIGKGKSEVILPLQLDEIAAKKVFGFLYSGNLDYVLRNPTYAILDCITKLCITELKEYYKCDELELHSEYKMEKSSFQYIIPVEKIANLDAIRCSSSTREDPSNRNFILHLYPSGLNKKSGDMSLSVENQGEIFPKISHVEISFLDGKGKRHVHRKECSDSPNVVCFVDFLRKDIIKNITSKCERNLQIVCNFYASSDGVIHSTIVDGKVHYNICIDPEKHYNTLSDNMTTLLETGIYSDLTLTCNEEKFRVHTYILGAKSYVLQKIFQSKEFLEGTRSLDASKIKSNILKGVLYYTYSGKLLEHKTDEILEIYKIADEFRVLSLKNICSGILQDNVHTLEPEIITAVVCLAEKCKDYKLIASVQNFIN